MVFKNDDNSLFLEQLALRTPNFRRNKDLEELLDELSGYLGAIEATIENRFDRPAMPPLFLVGNPRSGTSLFMQFLSLTNGFAVPTNLLSRFYYAPYIGAKIQELLTNPKYDYKNELTTENTGSALSSDLGRTKGILAPSEILHFWRQFLPRYDPQYLNEGDCKKIDITGLRKGVAAIESALSKPFASKAPMLLYNIDMLVKAFPNSILIHLQRNPIYVMQSIFMARETHYGNKNIWWSVKPKEYDRLKDMDVHHQIAGQVYYTERALKEQLTEIPEKYKIIVEYENFCSQPKETADAIEEKYSKLGHSLEMNIDTTLELEVRNKIRIDARDIHKMEKSYDYFKSL